MEMFPVKFTVFVHLCLYLEEYYRTVCADFEIECGESYFHF